MEGRLFVPAKPRRWSDRAMITRGVDVSRDGKRLVAVLPIVAAEHVHVTFLFHFFDEVRRRVRAGGK